VPPNAPPPSPPPSPATRADVEPAVTAVTNGSGQHATVAVAQPNGIELDLAGLRAVWPAVLEAVLSENALCAALLADAAPVAVDGAVVTIAFPPDADFLRRKANDDGYRRCVAEALRAVTGNRAQISYVLAELPAAEEHADAVAAPPTEEEWVRRFVAEFDAEEIVPDPEDPDLRTPS